MTNSDKYLAFFQGFAEADEELNCIYAHEVLGQKVPVISTGSYVLDDALSSLGYPKGRVIQLYGKKGCGKTLLSLIAIKNAQAENTTSKQLILDAEGTFNSSWAFKLDIDTSRIMVIDKDLAVNGQRCFEMLLGVPKSDQKGKLVGKSKEGLLDLISKGELDINLIIYDSLGALQPPKEDVAKVGQVVMMPLARFLTQEMKKISLEVKKAHIPFIVINHNRDTMDMYGADHTSAGGNSWHHFLSANIYLEIINRKDVAILDEHEEKIGHRLRATVEKSKFGPWPRVCEFDVDFNKGIVNSHKEIVELGLKYKVISNPAQGTYELNDIKWRGEKNLLEAVEKDPELFSNILNLISQLREKEFEEQRAFQELKKQENLELEKKSKKRKSTESNTITIEE